MTFIEAAKKSPHVRRPIAKHLGCHGDGWIDARVAFEQGRNQIASYYTPITWLLTWDDLMAKDWQAKHD